MVTGKQRKITQNVFSINHCFPVQRKQRYTKHLHVEIRGNVLFSMVNTCESSSHSSAVAATTAAAVSFL